MKIYLWKRLAWSQARFTEQPPCFLLAATLQGQIFCWPPAGRGSSCWGAPVPRGETCPSSAPASSRQPSQPHRRSQAPSAAFLTAPQQEHALFGYPQVGRAPLDTVSAAAAPGPREGSQSWEDNSCMGLLEPHRQAACGSCQRASFPSAASLLNPSQDSPASRQGGQLEEAAGRQDLGAVCSRPRARAPQESSGHGFPPALTSWGTRHEPKQ